MEAFSTRRRRLVQDLKSVGIIRSSRVERAFLTVPREEFVPIELRQDAYLDCPLPLMGTGQTISAPHMVAYMAEALDLVGCQKVLEVGAGSGYAAAILAEILNPTSEEVECPKVYSVEIDRALISFARANLDRTGYANRVEVVEGDGTLGLPRLAPFDRILVSAAAPYVPPNLTEQLAEGGKMLVPIGTGLWGQQLYLIIKEKGKTSKHYIMDVAFVSLRGTHGF